MIRREYRSDLLGRGDEIIRSTTCYCDSCSEENTPLYNRWGSELCLDCLVEEVANRCNFALECSECGKEENIYLYDNMYFCKNCLKEHIKVEFRYERVEVA